MSREEFLTRVRNAAAAGRAFRVTQTDVLPDRPGYCGAGDDPIARMAAEVEAVGGFARVVPDGAAALAVLGELLEARNAQSALCWDHPVLERLSLRRWLKDRQIDVIDHRSLASQERDAQRTTALAADVGISSVERAIAETGTLAMASRAGRERMTSLLPTLHVAIVEANQILPDLFDLFDELDAAGPDALPSNLTLITGPSKTGDLELQLTTGVHGPGEWHVIVIQPA